MTPITQHFMAFVASSIRYALDLTAVRNAITDTWSDGQTEGQINRLKAVMSVFKGSGRKISSGFFCSG
jgi:hypothetical protein